MIDIASLTPQQLDKFIHVQSIVDRQQAAQEKVRALRDYYYGNHPVYLTQRQKEYIGKDLTEGEFSFKHNLVRTVVDTLRERLDLVGFTVNGFGADDEGPEAEASRLLWSWWLQSRMDSQQIRLYRRTIRDGYSYVIVDYDNDKAMPRFTLHKSDDGSAGITYHRDPTDQNVGLFACRYFYTYDPLKPGATGLQRKTVYLPGEVRKYIMRGGGEWQQYDEEDKGEWPLSWSNSRGEPLGIAVIPFENPGGSEIDQIIGLQNALNKSWLDLIAAADTSGFPLVAVEYRDMAAFGMGAIDDDADLEGADELRLSPGRAIEVANANVKRLEAANLQPMIETMWAITTAMAGVSRTPQYYLRPVGGSDVPSGEALKQLESGLVKRAEERQLMFGQSWCDAMTLAYRVAQAFGSVPDLAELEIEAQWSDPNVRNEATQAQVAQSHKALGVPDDQVWSQLGYTPAEIAAFRQSARDERAADIANIASALNVQQARTNGQTQPQQFTNGNGG